MNGEPSKIEPVEVTKSTEPWSTYELKDGSTVKLKIILVDIGKAVDQYDEGGNPIYHFQTTQVVHINAPDKLKRKK